MISNIHSFIELFLILQKFSSIKFRNSISIIVVPFDSKSFRRIIYLFIVISHSIFQTRFSFSPFSSIPQFFRRFFDHLATPARLEPLLLLNQDPLSLALSPAHVLFSFRVITFEGSRNTRDPSLLDDAQPTRPRGIGFNGLFLRVRVFFILSLSFFFDFELEKLALLYAGR